MEDLFKSFASELEERKLEKKECLAKEDKAEGWCDGCGEDKQFDIKETKKSPIQSCNDCGGTVDFTDAVKDWD